MKRLSKLEPVRYYWKQCYELGDRVHWALMDTKTDSEAPPERVTCLSMILQAHHPDICGRPLDQDPMAKLIVELLNKEAARLARQMDKQKKGKK